MKSGFLLFLLPLVVAYAALNYSSILRLFYPQSTPFTVGLKSPITTATTNDSIVTPPAAKNPTFVLTKEEEMSFTASLVKPRSVAKIFLAIEQAEGAGARVRRSVGTARLRNFSPFLMLDHFFVGGKAGFPDHPHRGQETITYLLHGQVDHEDFTGSAGTIDEGDLQFMTAGKGIMHAEMPRPQKDGSPVVGLQLWVDLPEKLKSVEPRYRDLRKEEIPIVKPNDRLEIRVISGTSYGVDSVQDLAYTPVWMLDVTIQPGGSIQQPIPADYNTFAYVLEGELLVGTEKAKQYNNVVFNRDGDGIDISVPEEYEQAARFVIIAGKVLDQKVVQYGPFVAVSQEKIYEAVMDFQSNSNGFERGRNWESKIAKMIRN
ncbi:RmlC-like cupin domain-containing protein [Limtongia smithiae]|uniref:RmlC-like cupin domain-containing protein n=1 Tax=Limtongia smithiae TaxID=1125753 RepID=UPI0034CE7461